MRSSTANEGSGRRERAIARRSKGKGSRSGSYRDALQTLAKSATLSVQRMDEVKRSELIEALVVSVLNLQYQLRQVTNEQAANRISAEDEKKPTGYAMDWITPKKVLSLLPISRTALQRLYNEGRITWKYQEGSRRNRVYSLSDVVRLAVETYGMNRRSLESVLKLTIDSPLFAHDRRTKSYRNLEDVTTTNQG